MKNFTRHILLIIFSLFFISVQAQKKSAVIRGQVMDENAKPLSNVSVALLGQQKAISTNDSGFFRMKVPADKAFALLITYTGYKNFQENFLMNEGEEEVVNIFMERGVTELEEVVVTDKRDRREIGLIKPNPKSVINIPTPIGGVESLIKVFVGSNNELTSQYNVRGGSYDENLIYVNDFEIFRPYLVRSGQQEGLSFINPALVRNINFYNGGFQARYGDKMSSVLDIQYNTPKTFGGSAYLGILEQGFHVEGATQKNKLTYVVGVRNRTNRNLLSRQETQGNYVPSSADIQALISYQLNEKWQAEILANLSKTKFTLEPEFSKLTSSVFSPYYTQNLSAEINFIGREKDGYTTAMAGTSLSFQPNKNLRLKWLFSRFENDEKENIDITGFYLFGEVASNSSSSASNPIVNPLGAGLYQNYARNALNIVDYNFSHKGTLNKKNHLLQWGFGYDNTVMADVLNEWEFKDSAGYSLPYSPNVLELNKVLRSAANIHVNKLNGYLQDNIAFNDTSNAITMQVGLRFNYNDLNNEVLLSPRLGASWKPDWKRDIIFKVAAGAYHQPPFYREMRRYDGTLNTSLKAQRSWQTIAGFDYNFIGLNRPLRLTTEAFYKSLSNVVPYDIDNVRIRYFGENMAKAYAAGIEMRLFGEVVKEAESWISLGIMRTRENITNDVYKNYTVDSTGTPVDSMSVEGGWLRRPTDRLITFGMFFQDYLSNNKNFKVYISTLYGTNLPYNIPGSVKYRNALTIQPYIRADIGFSALLLDTDKSNRRSHGPFRNFENIWASLEIFNLIDRPNTISYLLLKDFSNNTFAMPNRLTPRLLNFKIVARW